MLTRDEVLWAYRFILDRDPESEAVIADWRRCNDWRELRTAMFHSAEFKALGKSIFTTGKWVMCEVLAGRASMWVDLADEYVSFGCLIDNYEPAETAVFRSLIKPGFHIADVGANVGWFTVLAADALQAAGAGHVYAFEPQRPTVDYLRRTVEANRHQSLVTVVDAALGARQGAGELTWHAGARDPGGAHLSPGGSAGGGQPIRIETLDAHFAYRRLDLVKIDVEGAEPLALRGGSATLRRDRPVVMCELNPGMMMSVSGVGVPEFRRMMEHEFGYRTEVIGPDHRLSPAPADLNMSGATILNVVFSPGPA